MGLGLKGEIDSYASYRLSVLTVGQRRGGVRSKLSGHFEVLGFPKKSLFRFQCIFMYKFVYYLEL